METKYVRVPFDVEMAKKITNGEVEGRVVTRDGRSVRILCFDRKGKSPIITLVLVDGKEEGFTPYLLDGRLKPEKEDRFDLMLEIPEYMTFKDGDVLYCKGFLDWVFIYKKGCHKTSYYAAVGLGENGLYYNSHTSSDNNIHELRLATEEEKQKLIDALKASKEPKAKECLKMLGIEVKPECEFKPFDKVLVRDDKEHDWNADLFSHINKLGNFVCLGSSWVYCIPYNEQTAHLLGTNDNWEEKICKR
ncbi:hypothetical protein [Phocaeicola coprophilus]|uniref:hypothetical protein n=1 Tax=Phocaeicola coprophilus TaxID=387090 RepID=UPI0039F49632